MYLEFENNNVIDNDFPNKKEEGKRWYTRSQPCLLFKDDSKYPDNFELNISFSDNPTEQKSISAFAPGFYVLAETAYGFDNRRNPTVVLHN